MNEIVFIALGSNIGNRLNHIQTAIYSIAKLPNTKLLALSSLYQNPAVAPNSQDNYYNAVVQLTTELDALTLLDHLQTIESVQGKRSNDGYSARTIDCDILLYGNQTLHHPRLTIPHYAMHQRLFVLLPLYELAPQLQLPNGMILTKVIQSAPQHPCEKLAINLHFDNRNALHG